MLADDRIFAVFIIETRYQGQPMELTWNLTQRIPLPARNKQREAVYNQVQAYLHDLSLRTGFDYLILYWGSLEGAKQYTRHNQLTLF